MVYRISTYAAIRTDYLGRLLLFYYLLDGMKSYILGPTPSAAERKALWDQANGEAATWIDYPRAAADIGKVFGGSIP